jgi:transposase
MTVQNIRTILRLMHEQGLSVREVGLRLKLSKTTVAPYVLWAREAGLNVWPLPPGRDDDATLFQWMGRPPQDLEEPDWAKVATLLKRKGVTLVLLWQEYRATHPDGYGYTWFREQFRAFEESTSPSFRNRHEAGAVMQTDYAGHTIPIADPASGGVHQAQIFVAVLGASSQLPVSGWHQMIGESPIADAILDRIIHNAQGERTTRSRRHVLRSSRREDSVPGLERLQLSEPM